MVGMEENFTENTTEFSSYVSFSTDDLLTGILNITFVGVREIIKVGKRTFSAFEVKMKLFKFQER